MSSESPRRRLDAEQPTLLDATQWHAGPTVVESSGQTDTVHAPDKTSDEPLPACKQSAENGLENGREWMPKRLNGGLAAFRRPCSCDECRGRLEALADVLEVEFDG